MISEKADDTPQQTIESKLQDMATIVESGLNNVFKRQGTGFFYYAGTPVNSKAGGTKRKKLDGHWLITNRHIVLPKINDKEIIPDYFTFNFRETTANKQIDWLPITYSYQEICEKIKLHPNSLVDVAAINIDDILLETLMERKKSIIMPSSLTGDNLPGISPFNVEAGGDVLVLSYPRGFYDTVNKLPIIKSGIVATAWGENFNGQPTFLIDSKLFPGSSGALVISRSTNTPIVSGRPLYNSIRKYLFLGVYSGEAFYHTAPIEIDGLSIVRKESYGLGNVWYGALIPTIIEKGKSIGF